MRRHRRGYLSGLFFNTGNYDARSENDTFGFTRQFAESINQEMMDDERLDQKHKREEALRQQEQTDQETPDTGTDNPEAA